MASNSKLFEPTLAPGAVEVLHPMQPMMHILHTKDNITMGMQPVLTTASHHYESV